MKRNAKREKNAKNTSLNSIRKELQKSHLILIMLITIFLSVGGALISINVHNRTVDQNLLNTSNLILRLYGFTHQLSSIELSQYFNSICTEIPEVDVISIVDKNNIRLYHTNNNLIGTFYDGNIPDFSKIDKKIQIQNENGVSGLQRRTYCAIYNQNGEYCGFIMTIILKTSIRSITFRTALLFFFVTLAAILIEIIISNTFSKRIKQKLLGFEPDTFSSMFTVRDDILEMLNEGIVAVDKNKNVQFINKAAKKMLFGKNFKLSEKIEKSEIEKNEKCDAKNESENCKKCDEKNETKIAQNIENVETESENFSKIIEIKQKLFAEKILKIALQNQSNVFALAEKTDEGIEMLVDCLPIKKDKNIAGSVAILHDRSEYTKLMEDLAGTKYLVDAMRANNHDFTNKLHVILGLIQIGEYQKAVSYIENISLIQKETLSRIMHSVDNASLAALLIGKIARSSECNVKFILQEGSCYKSAEINFPSEALVTICGNLIDNALDAMNTNSNIQAKNSELVFAVFTKSGELFISVKDNGCGIEEKNMAKIFENGFSTKGKNRGIGLYHCKQLVESLGGKISFETNAGIGTVFTVIFKNQN